ncbi:MAG: hypothetical protein NWF04_09475 [Candidatus Bathyarchaeota archaeon]|nr:hypothetical protein [Candidatus Bathyarchaeota archaeon]
MKAQEHLIIFPGKVDSERENSIADTLNVLDRQCKACKPVSPLECMTRCKVWKLRNELRHLCETMENPNFLKDLLNVLKNDTRIAILQATAKSRYSAGKLQTELRKEGYIHSQDTLINEYLKPLMDVGLVTEAQDQFYATIFGGRFAKLIKNIPDFGSVLPARSECYEETLLVVLLDGPKTFEEIDGLVPSNIVSRILKRLKTSELIATSQDRDYIFFFRSKRDPAKETLRPTENKVYWNIPEQGISAKKLSDETQLSLRRTYKYLRGLKGKKLIFTRKTPKTYKLTQKGERTAWLLNEINTLVNETMYFSEQFIKHKQNT